MFARNLSFVSCSVACSPERMCPVPRVARIDATTGLQIAHPEPLPCRLMTSLNLEIRVALMISNSSARDCVKCSHSDFDCSTPHADSSLPSIGTQEPLEVPARVQDLIFATESHPPSVIE